MRIEIDQSGKLEDTNRSTAIGFSNGQTKTIIISSREKQKLQRHFRQIQKPRMYVYSTFSIMIFLLINKEKNLSQVCIDKEYVGQEALIKNLLLSRLKPIDKKTIYFKEIGRKSPAHSIAWNSYQSKRADIRITADKIIKLL